MRRGFVGALAVVALASSFATAPASATPRPTIAAGRPSLSSVDVPSVPGEVIVKFRGGVARAHAVRRVAALGGSVEAGPHDGFALVTAPPGVSTEEALAAYSRDPAVAFAERNLLRFASAVPDDPRFPEQWATMNTGQSHPISGMPSATRAGTSGADIDAPEAWDTTTGDGTVVAIMDSGVDVAHPDLAANVWVNQVEADGVAGLDDDRNGYVDDVNGWDFADDDASLFQATGGFAGYDHGTHVAGIIGAVANNGTGVAGVCPGCKLMVLKVFEPFDTDGDGIKDTMVGDVASALEAFDYAIAMGADVVNGSFGGSILTSRAERAKIKKAIAAGITMVFASGNENGDNDLLVPELDVDRDGDPDLTSPAYPASYDLPGIIAVAASNDMDQNAYQSACYIQLRTRASPCSFTNWGRESVDVSAPGVDILSTVPNASYDVFDGTSMAAPHVAGMAALVKAHNPSYSPVQVKNAILNAAEKPSSLGELFPFPGSPSVTGRFTVTTGRVAAAAALSASPIATTTRSDGNIAGATPISRAVRGSVSWPEDVNDVFKKRLDKGAVYRVTLDTTGDADLDMQIYKPRTKDIWQVDDTCLVVGGRCQLLYYDPQPSGDAAFRFKARRAGPYYFHVNAWLLETGSYQLKVVKR